MTSAGSSTGGSMTFRRYRDGDAAPPPWREQIFDADHSHKCPTYVLRTPPCQSACPSGHDIRGWMNLARGIERPPAGMSWQEYAFRRMTDANPFPAIMGRVCPAPCQQGCNRGQIDEHVGINAIEQYVGDHALTQGWGFAPPATESGKRVALIGGGPASLACAYQLRRRGHQCVIFEEHAELGGMLRYGIPGYRTPRAVLDGEIARIVAMGIEVRCNTRVGRDITLARLEAEFDAIFLGLGAQAGAPLDVPGAAGVANCITGVTFLAAFNDGRLHHLKGRVLVIGGGDTAMDVAAVARRLGCAADAVPPEAMILGQATQDVATAARREGAEVVIVYRRPIAKAPAARHEIEAVRREGVEILDNLVPLAVLTGPDGRAVALRVARVAWTAGRMVQIPDSETELPCDLIVSAIGQSGDLRGLEAFDNGQGLISVDRLQRAGRPGVFAAGDVIKPYLLTTAIGAARVAAEGIDHHLRGAPPKPRPKVDVHHFNLLGKLAETGRAPTPCPPGAVLGSDLASFAVHNLEDRGRAAVVPAEEQFLAHFPPVPPRQRREREITAANVLGNDQERLIGFSDDDAVAEAKRCMSCGLCFECDNCLIYCPQKAVQRVPKSQATIGRYVTTDYDRCIGCHICRDVCPTGYIQMGLGEG